jgi:hypothetical protein
LPGESYGYVVYLVPVYVVIAAVAALNSLMEGPPPVDWRSLAVIALTSLLWPIALFAITIAVAVAGAARSRRGGS